MTTIKLKNGSGAPTAGDLVQGEPALDLTNKRLYTENASGTVIEVGTNPTSITTGDITATGTATFANLATSGDVTFGDNDKAIFGAGSDLQIYHDGSNSYVQDSGTGDLWLAGTQVRIANADGTKTNLYSVDGAQVSLRFNGTEKLATTSTGIDVTGILTADGLTVNSGGDQEVYFGNNTDGVALSNTGVSSRLEFGASQSTGGVAHFEYNRSNGSTIFAQGTNGSETTRAMIANGGDISFYNSAGTSQDLYWDASTSRLGLGTTSPPRALTVNIGTDNEGIRLNSSNTYALYEAIDSGGSLAFGAVQGEFHVRVAGANQFQIESNGTTVIRGSDANLNVDNQAGAPDKTLALFQADMGVNDRNFQIKSPTTDSASAPFRFTTGNSFAFEIDSTTDALVIDANANIGIGNSTPTEDLHIGDGTASVALTLQGTDAGINAINMGDATNRFAGRILYNNSSNDFAFHCAGSERVRFASSGNVGIGTDTPSNDLHVNSSGNTVAKISSTFSGSTTTGLYIDTVGDTSAARLLFSKSGVTRGLISYSHNASAASESINFSTGSGLITTMKGGKVGIGTDAPAETLEVAGTFTSKGLTAYDEAAKFKNDGSAVSWARADWINDQASGTGIVYRDQAGSFVFRNDNNSGTATTTQIVAGGTTAGNIVFSKDATGSGEVGRFDTNGNLLVGTTSTNPHTTSNAAEGGTRMSQGGLFATGRNANPSLHVNRITDDGLLAMWYRNGTNVGNISVTSTATTYNTSSDQRLKDNIVDAPSASDDIDAIQVRSFDWKADGSHQKYGMVAQELNTVAPEAVTEGDTEDDMMSVDYSKLVPMLVKEIQSLRARVAQLEND